MTRTTDEQIQIKIDLYEKALKAFDKEFLSKVPAMTTVEINLQLSKRERYSATLKSARKWLVKRQRERVGGVDPGVFYPRGSKKRAGRVT